LEVILEGCCFLERKDLILPEINPSYIAINKKGTIKIITKANGLASDLHSMSSKSLSYSVALTVLSAGLLENLFEELHDRNRTDLE
jgi:hypothetical protein